MATIKLSEIRANPVALRTVNRESPDYLSLVDSIRQIGFKLSTITVRSQRDKDSGESFFELVDGLQRYSAAKDAGLTEIEAIVTDFDDDQVLEAQILANLVRIETKPMEYTAQLKRILKRNQHMTENELAVKCCKSPSWIKDRLSLSKIDDPILHGLIDSGKIVLANAYALAKLPINEQGNFKEQALTMPADEFIPLVNARAKEIRDAKNRGEDVQEVTFVPVAHMQKLSLIKAECDSPTVAPKILAATGAETAAQGWAAAIQWTLHLDPDSVAMQRARYEARLSEQAEARKKRGEEKAKRTAEKAEKMKADAEKILNAAA